jgi:hypothetical protein
MAFCGYKMGMPYLQTKGQTSNMICTQQATEIDALASGAVHVAHHCLRAESRNDTHQAAAVFTFPLFSNHKR